MEESRENIGGTEGEIWRSQGRWLEESRLGGVKGGGLEEPRERVRGAEGK